MEDWEFDAETVALLRQRAKQHLRQRMRQLRLSHPAGVRERWSQELAAQLLALPEFEAASSVALFWPIERLGEVDLRSVDAAARAAGKRVFYPTEREERPALARVMDPLELIATERGTREPPASEPIAEPGDVALVVVPALAVAASGHRLGYGGGFYDRLLERYGARTVACAFEFQLLAEVPHEAHDRPCNVIVTEARVLRANASGA